jgi:hypothetical protein
MHYCKPSHKCLKSLCGWRLSPRRNRFEWMQITSQHKRKHSPATVVAKEYSEAASALEPEAELVSEAPVGAILHRFSELSSK